jgi:hypothetical protein
VAATELDDRGAGPQQQARVLGSVVLAALSLPGVLPATARAESAPEQGIVSVRHLHYEDRQAVQVRYPDYTGNEPDSFKRITVDAPSVYVLAPLGTRWSLEGSLVHDQVSGATPRFYSSISGATVDKGMEDQRTAGDLKVTRYLERAAVGLGVSHSTEHDYESSALSLDGRYSSADNNTTWNLGVGGSSDRIGSSIDPDLHKRKRTAEFLAGVTQALNANDIAQVNLSYTQGKGYYSDPYKLFDNRPELRRQGVLLTRWNHHFTRLGSTLRNSYRYYRDSFGIRAHAAEAAWVQPLGRHVVITPSMRYATQSSAWFYYDPVGDTSVFPGPVGAPGYTSTDQRLSAFGAVTLGLKAELRVGDWSADVKYERYEQRSQWRSFGKGSPGIDPFIADFVQVGVSRKF